MNCMVNELYLSSFSSFIEVWIGTVVFAFFTFFLKGANLKSRAKVYNKLSSLFNEIINKYQSLVDDKIIDISSYRFDDYLSIKSKHACLLTVIYGLFILLYIGFEEKTEIFPVLILTNIVFIYFLLTISFYFSKHLFSKSYIIEFMFFLLILGLFLFYEKILYAIKSFPDYYRYLSYIPHTRSHVTIYTLITCSISILLALCWYLIVDLFQLKKMREKIKKLELLDSSLQRLIALEVESKMTKIDDKSEKPNKKRKKLKKSSSNSKNRINNNGPSQIALDKKMIKNTIQKEIEDFLITFGVK